MAGIRTMALLVGVLALTATEGYAQSPVAGTYEWDMDMMVRRTGDGTETTGEKAKVRLVLEVKGDSVFGTYDVIPPPHISFNVPTRQIKGTVAGNKVVFSLNGQARVNMNGEERPIETVAIYHATVDGDDIRGTIDVQTGDSNLSIPQRSFTGKRVKTS